MAHSDVSGIVYKYVGQAGARAILANRTLRFTRPSEMSDPFDVYIDDLFDTPLAELLNRTALMPLSCWYVHLHSAGRGGRSRAVTTQLRTAIDHYEIAIMASGMGHMTATIDHREVRHEPPF